MVDYWSAVIGRAAAESWDLLAAQPLKVFLLYCLVIAVASAIQYVWLGWRVMTDQAKTLITILGASVIVGLFIVGYKIVATPPVLYTEQKATYKAEVSDLIEKHKNEIDELKTLLESERAKSRPVLMGQIENLYSGKSDDGSAVIHILMSIKNIGAPSIADHYFLVVDYGGNIFSTLPTVISADTKLAMKDKHLPMKVIHKKDALYEKTITPIPSGGLVRGWLKFKPPVIKPEEVLTAGSKLTVTFQDVSGASYKATHIIPETRDNIPMYYPGSGD